MKTTAAAIEQVSIEEIAQMYIRDTALNLGASNRYDFAVKPENAVRLLDKLHKELHFTGSLYESAAARAILMAAEPATPVDIHIVVHSYFVLQVYGYSFLYANIPSMNQSQVAPSRRSHSRSYYG